MMPGWLLAIALLLALGGGARAANENDLKTAYLFNFASLVEWPPSAFAGPLAPVVIGFVGNDAMADQLEARIGSRKAKGRRVEVRRVSPADGAALRNCHVLYLADAEAGRVETVLREVQGSPVLTVGDAENFVRRGGMIGFEVQEKSVRFSANPRAAKSGGLSLGSDVLRLAREVFSR
ncbi:MAG: hypothetical protein QOE70_1794 [Chthoniobacter sp.]|jgi:hypothetical protein|nr:hypothetical protein [Chthoniobacter sp.]